MLESFSQRTDVVKKPAAFQKESATPLLRTDLWNVWYVRYWHHESRDNYLAVDDKYLDFLWTQLLHGELNVLHRSGFGNVLGTIHKAWFEGDSHLRIVRAAPRASHASSERRPPEQPLCLSHRRRQDCANDHGCRNPDC